MRNATVCQLYCADTELKYLVNKCVNGYYPMDKYPDTTDSYKRCGTLAEACRDAGRSVSADGKKCDCGGLMYEWSDTELKCVESKDYKACNMASNAYWTIDYGCRCKDPQQYYWDESAHECRIKPDQAGCEDIKGNLKTIIQDNKTKVNWNHSTRECECIKDADGNDIDEPDYYYIDNVYRCVKKRYILRLEEVERNKPAANAKQGEIYAIIDDLKNLSDDMGKSHWKNASGGFNTARLASDSIAGVVLGTVGGVITSNVIKKNQVKGGFEDINCTVGGQRVAGFADEFNVGIQ
ncbi:MAG: hypothetical protein ACI4NZ_02990 [Candidatus Enterousia sp.]